MSTLIVAAAVFIGYIIAYNTYGRFLARKIFRLSPNNPVPSRTHEDGNDYVPTNRHVLFGHHFTSIAGTGPIVGPAIAVFWGWLPALLWVFFGSILIGAVHDLTSLVVSSRNDGQTVGDIAGRLISPWARFLFLTILAFALMLVIGIFGLVIATIFQLFPESVFPVWFALPVAIVIGIVVHRRQGHLLVPSLIALALLYLAISVGCYVWPIQLPDYIISPTYGTPVIIWTVLLLIYCYIASVLPVWMLLQPRDYVNSHSLLLTMVLLIAGLGIAGLSGQADLYESAPAVTPAADIPGDAPPLWPFLFITIACGATSGFHSMVSSGTSSKQLASEPDALMVGYGSMLLEGGLAVLVILACCAGIGMTPQDESDPMTETGHPKVAVAVVDMNDPADVAEHAARTEQRTGIASMLHHYGNQSDAWVKNYGDKDWKEMNLGAKVGVFIEGGANFVAATGVPLKLAVGIMAVLVASFAATTLDTATRLQRYVIQEWATMTHIKPMTNKYVATAIAVLTGGCMALMPGKFTPEQLPIYGTGGLILWPLFATLNQVIAGFALMVGVFYLLKCKIRSTLLAVPLGMMLVLPAWALIYSLFNSTSGWLYSGRPLLVGIGLTVLVCELLLILEAWRTIQRMIIGRDASPPPGERSADDGT